MSVPKKVTQRKTDRTFFYDMKKHKVAHKSAKILNVQKSILCIY